jgi:Icc-related predicted phosphoesterase
MTRRPQESGGLRCFFASDLHGRVERYRRLLRVVEEEVPAAVLLGGDLLPSGYLASWDSGEHGDFVREFLSRGFAALRGRLGDRYPMVVLILGNDDPRAEEIKLLEGEREGLWRYAHGRRIALDGHVVYGYSFVPPTPFLLKDWERYDVSRFVDPACVSPEEGRRSVPVRRRDARYRTIEEDLERLAGESDQACAVWLFHTPPYASKLDRATLDGKTVDHAPLDPHIGSVAVRRFIDARQPLVTLHGHVHESTRLTGSWRDRVGRTHLFSAAHDGPELALVRFDLEDLDSATRELV